MMYAETVPLEWMPFYKLNDRARQSLYRRQGEVAKHRLYAWDESSKAYIWRVDDDSPYVVATGEQLSRIGIRGFGSKHLWVMRPSDMGPRQWADLFALVTKSNKVELFRVCIAGGRDFDDYGLLKQRMDALLKSKHPNVCVVCGCAKGADTLGERYAKERGYAVERYPADWEKHGKAAGPKRNAEMASVSDACVVFWDGVSRGSANMIEQCKKRAVPLRVVRYAIA